MDIFKLIFEHDLRLDKLRERHTDRSSQEVGSSIEEFMKPDPTYSKFYMSGTVLDKEQFGLSCISKFNGIVKALEMSFEEYRIFNRVGEIDIREFFEKAEIGKPVILSKKVNGDWNFEALDVDDESNVGHKKEGLAEVLQSGDLVLYKEKAHHGYDLHLFSKDNIYPQLFYPFRALVGPAFRFFSINGKRIRSEQKFYFETWTLDRPPHGAEEVFESTEL